MGKYRPRSSLDLGTPNPLVGPASRMPKWIGRYILGGAASLLLLAAASAEQGQNPPTDTAGRLSACQVAGKKLVWGAPPEDIQNEAKTAIQALTDPGSYEKDLECWKGVLADAHEAIIRRGLQEAEAFNHIGKAEKAIESASATIEKLNIDATTFDDNLKKLQGALSEARKKIVDNKCGALQKLLEKGQFEFAQTAATKFLEELETEDKDAFRNGLDCVAEIRQKAQAANLNDRIIKSKELLAKGDHAKAKTEAESIIGELHSGATSFDSNLKELQAVLTQAKEGDVQIKCDGLRQVLAQGDYAPAKTKALELLKELNAGDGPAFSKGLECVTETLQKAKQGEERHLQAQLTSLARLGRNEKVTEILDNHPDLALAGLSPEARSTFDVNVPLWQQLHGHTADVLLPENIASETSPWVEGLKSFLKQFLRTLTLFEFGLLAVVAFFAWRKLIWAKPTLAMEGFYASGNPSDKRGDFEMWVRAQLLEMTAGRGRDRSLTFLHGPISNVDVGADLPALPRGIGGILKNVAAVFDFLFKRRALQVHGELMPSASKDRPNGDPSASCEVQMRRGDTVIAETVVRVADFRVAGDMGQNDERLLAEFVGIWIAFQCRRHNTTLVPGFVNFLRTRMSTAPRFLGTNDWQPYALAHAAVKMTAAPKTAEAESATTDRKKNAQQLLRRALERDQEFLAARVNLGSLTRQLQLAKGGSAYRPQEIYDFLNCDPTLKPGWWDIVVKPDPAAIAHQFLSSALAFDASCQLDVAGSGVDTSQGTQWLNLALKDSIRLMARLNQGRWFDPFRDVSARDYLIWRRPIAESLCWGLGVKAQDRAVTEQRPNKLFRVTNTKAQEKLEKLEKVLANRLDYHSLYNLACTFAMFCEFAPNESLKVTWARKALRYLESSHELAQNVASTRGGPAIGDQGDRIKRAAKADCAFKFVRETRIEDLGYAGEKPASSILTEFFGSVPDPSAKPAE